MILEGVYRRFTPLKGGRGPIDARFTHQESLAVGLVEPKDFETTRAGRRFYVGYNGTVPTGIAPVQAFPTVAAQWALFNSDAQKSAVFTKIGALLFSGTKGLGGVLLGCMFTLPDQTGIAQATGLAPAAASKLSSSATPAASSMVIKSAITITNPALPLWFPIAEDELAVATVGPANCMTNRLLDGRIILPPKTGLGLVVLAPAGTTPLYLPQGDWVEIEADLE